MRSVKSDENFFSQRISYATLLSGVSRKILRLVFAWYTLSPFISLAEIPVRVDCLISCKIRL